MLPVWMPSVPQRSLEKREYHFYRDGVLLATVQASSATVGGLTSGEAVTLTVRAVNATGEGPTARRRVGRG